MPTHAEIFWQQSAELFERWQRLLERDPAHVRRECALYRRWALSLEPSDRDSALIIEVLLEMLAELMVEATLRE